MKKVADNHGVHFAQKLSGNVSICQTESGRDAGNNRRVISMKIFESLYLTSVGRINFWLERGGWIELGLIALISLVFLSIGYILGKKRKYAIENRGEALVRKYLMEYCENRNAHVLSNITLKLEDGSTTQIDHILVTIKGIFVIETKHYNGWIFANPKTKLWTQIIYKVKNKFQNPLFQNYRHVKAIQILLDFLDPRLIYNFVVFSGGARFKTEKPRNVYFKEELIPAIDQYVDGLLSINHVQFCVGRLEPGFRT